MKTRKFLFLLFIISITIIIFSCDITLLTRNNSDSESESGNMEPASNYNYGYGTFGNLPSVLKKANGNIIIEGLDFVYNQTLINIYDPNNNNEYDPGKFFRIVNNSLNVANSSGLNLTPVAKDLSSSISSPPMDSVYIDPINGKFIMPRPDVWTRCENYLNITSNPEIGSGNGEIVYGTSVSNTSYSFNTGKINNCLRMTSAKSFNGGIFMYWYPNGLTPQISETGTVSFWFNKGENHDYTHYHFALGGFFIGLFSKNNEITINDNSSNQTSYTYNNWDSYAHIYIIWDKNKSLQSNTKSAIVYLNGQEIVSISTDLNDFTATDFIRFKGEDFWNDKQVGINLDNFKMWNHIVSEDPSWIYNIENPTNGSEYDDAIHLIYNINNNYKPKDIQVGYF